jgi:hypothetical protein
LHVTPEIPFAAAASQYRRSRRRRQRGLLLGAKPKKLGTSHFQIHDPSCFFQTLIPQKVYLIRLILL